ncbi:uncharacterized protein LOC133793736 [Humulus lupulus]|uniref:uncharacterized protein LOC133793736 n=1 Tax=Humulus lupulus TaxID=3486 RepID=UPI002B418470|nr:uncharacterized protein LOC133793736 [Humulus lupulus]
MDHFGECGGVSGSEKKISGIVEDESKNVGDDIGEILPRRSNITHLKSVARKKSKSPSSVARKTRKSPSTVKQTKDSCASGSKDAGDDSHETKHVVLTILNVYPSFEERKKLAVKKFKFEPLYLPKVCAEDGDSSPGTQVLVSFVVCFS